MRSPASWALLGGLVAMVAALALFDWFLFTGGDNAGYYALTKAIAEGEGFVDLVTPGTPPETVYPPGYPILLVPFYWLFGGTMAGLKLASLVAGAMLLLAIWKLARTDVGVPAHVAVASVWLVGLSPSFLKYTHYVLSDMVFAAVVFLSLWCLTRSSVGDALDLRWWALGCALAIAAFYVRTAGVTLLAAALVWLAFERRWRLMGLILVVFAAASGPWLWWTSRNPPATGGYLQQVQSSDRINPESGAVGIVELIGRSWGNLSHYARFELPQLMWPFVPPPLWLQAVGLMVGSAALGVGIWTLIRRRGVAVSEIFFFATGGVIVVWPWVGDRFFLPIAPLAWIYMLVGLGAASKRLDRWRPTLAVPALVVLVLLIGAARLAPLELSYTRRYLDGEEMAGYSTFWQDYFQSARWIAEDDPSAVILARKPRLAWYWSRRPSLVYPFHGDPERTWNFVRSHDVTHILVEPLTEAFLAPMIATHVHELDLVYAGPNRDVFVLRVRPSL